MTKGSADPALLLSRREAADALAVSVDTLARLVAAGELSAVRIGRCVLVPREDVLALIERRRGIPRKPARPTCSRCHRRIVGPRLVVNGAWMCSECMYELEQAAGRDRADAAGQEARRFGREPTP